MGKLPTIDRATNEATHASLRQVPWHGAGYVTETPLSTQQMMIAAKMDNLNERKVKASEIGSSIPFADANQHFVLGDNPFTNSPHILGPVKSRYEVYTTDELFALGDILSKENREWETMGALDNFRLVYGCLKFTNGFTLDPNGSNDKIDKFLLLFTSHVGNGKVIAKETNVRVECTNVFDSVMKGQGSRIAIAHTRNMRDRLAEAQRIMALTDSYNEKFELVANELFATQTTDAKFWSIVDALFPQPEEDNKNAMTRWTNRIDNLDLIWKGETGSMDNLPKNAWRIANTFLEYDQWFGSTKGTNAKENAIKHGAGFSEIAISGRQQIMDAVHAMV